MICLNIGIIPWHLANSTGFNVIICCSILNDRHFGCAANSLLVVDSTRDGWITHEHLRGYLYDA